MADGFLLENSSGRFLLESGTGIVLLEISAPVVTFSPIYSVDALVQAGRPVVQIVSFTKRLIVQIFFAR